MGWAQAILSAAALVTLVIGVYLNKHGTHQFQPNEVLAPEVLSEATIEPKETIPPMPSPTVLVSLSPTAKPTESPINNSSDWVYPSSEIITAGLSSTTLVSNDDPDKIVDWYKEKFNDNHLNIKTTVKTKVNDNYLAKMAGEKIGLNVSIEVKRNAGDSKATINIIFN